MNTPNLTRRSAVAATLIAASGLSGVALAQPAAAPIRIGSTLALTGPLSATAQVH
jgi:hypothetical protein